jgi:hypothetical protein
MSGNEFVGKYYSKVSNEVTKPIAEAQVKGAYQYLDRE